MTEGTRGLPSFGKKGIALGKIEEIVFHFPAVEHHHLLGLNMAASRVEADRLYLMSQHSALFQLLATFPSNYLQALKNHL